MMTHMKEMELAIRIRCIEEALLDLFNKGKLNGTVHTCIGQEFSGVAISKNLTENDFVISNHRGHGHYIARTNDMQGLFSELMGKINGCSGGIGGSQHLYNHNYLSNGIQGGMTPIAAGISMGFKRKENNAIVVVYIGDGTLGEGVFYETMNISAKWELPVLFVLENNGIAQSTSLEQTLAGNIQNRCEGFGLEYFKTTTNDLTNLFTVTSDAVSFVRNSSKPALVEIKTNRLFSHSKGDDNRDQDYVKDLKALDPINLFAKEHPQEYDIIKSDLLKEIENVINISDASDTLKDFPDPDYHEKKKPIYSLLQKRGMRYNEEIYASFKDEMESNDFCIILGEDIETDNVYNSGEYGGAFKVTRNLSKLFPNRVINTPISEAAIVGIGTGLTLVGFRPIVEIMFGDFLTLTLDQLLQHAAKFRLMYNKQVSVPLIVRTPMGGHRGYGPTHSQSLEKFFLGIPGLNVVALNHRLSPGIVYKEILRQKETPYLVIENKVLYTKFLNKEDIPGYTIEISDCKFPCVRIRPTDVKPDITIVGYGGTLLEIEDAIFKLFYENEITCEVICPSMIYPINIEPMIASVQNTSHLLVVEEGTSAMAFGSEIIALLGEYNCFPKKVKRIANNTIIPCSFEAEKRLLPNSEKIIEMVVEMIG